MDEATFRKNLAEGKIEMPKEEERPIAEQEKLDKKESEYSFEMPTWETLERKDGFYLNVFLPGVQAQTAGNYGVFFIVRYACEVVRISEVHAVAGSDAGAVTLDIEKLTGTQALGGGVSLLAATFNLKSTANTVVVKEGVASKTGSTPLSDNRRLSENNRLALKVSGVLTALQGLQVTLYCKPLGRGNYR